MTVLGCCLRAGIAVAVLALVTPACSLVKGQQFGVSRSGADVLVWFVDCYAPPLSVTLFLSGSYGSPIWQVGQQSSASKRSAFPSGTRVGDIPPGYDLTHALDVPLAPTATYRIAFYSGEAYVEDLDFIPSELSGDVLTFDHQVMTTEEFTQQAASDHPAT
jgi:hypothetical protein